MPFEAVETIAGGMVEQLPVSEEASLGETSKRNEGIQSDFFFRCNDLSSSPCSICGMKQDGISLW